MTDDPSKLHPAFARADRKYQWQGSLERLEVELTKKAKHRLREDRKDLTWTWFILPRGALVAKRFRGDMNGRMELRIAREEPPKGEAGRGKWNREIGVFLDKMGFIELDGQTPCRHPGRHLYRHVNELENRAEVCFIELRLGETRPGVARCERCFQEKEETVEIPWWSAGGFQGQRCNACALRGGQERAAKKREKREQLTLEPGGEG